MYKIVICLQLTCIFFPLIGCTQKTVLDNPADLPDEWAGRKLYNTQIALIYARNETIAGEAENIAISASKDFTSQTDGKATKGLIIVTDPGDAQNALDARWIFDEITTQQAQRDGNPAPSDKQLQEKWDKLQSSFAESGVEIDCETMFFVKPIALNPEKLADDLDFPADASKHASWAVAIPSKKLVRNFFGTTIKAALESKDVGAEKIVIILLMPLIEPKVGEKSAKEIKALIYDQLVQTQADWDDSLKKAEMSAYQDKNKEQFNMFQPPSTKKARKTSD